MSIKHWHRYPADGWIAGVCAGLGAYFGWNVKLLRVLFVIGLLFSGFFPVGLAYCVLWYLMDERPGSAAAASDDTPSYARGSSAGAAPAYASGASMSDVKARFSRMEERLRSMEECVSSRDFELRQELKKLES